jgi:hypothetical protein
MSETKKTIPITDVNMIYAFCELNFTHDHSTVVEGSYMIDRSGTAWKVTKIVKNDCGNKEFWSEDVCLTEQYKSPHNMLTKSPQYAHEFKIVKP